MISINSNTSFLMIQRGLNKANSSVESVIKRISSGCRINNAGDDAAGLSLSTKQNSEIRALSHAKMNIQTGINLLNIADSAVDGMITTTQRMRDLAVQAANGNYGTGERQSMQDEINELTKELNQIKSSTKFNEMNIFDSPSSTGENSTRTMSAASMSKDEALAKGYIVIENSQDFIDKIINAASTSGKTFVLTNDIDMSSVSSYNTACTFEGTLNGNGHTLSNLTIRGGDLAALFTEISTSGVVKNLTLSNFDVNGYNYVGALASAMYGRVENCHLKDSTVTGNNWVGGLISGSTGTIVNSSVGAVCTVNGRSNVGGLLSANTGGRVISSYVENTNVISNGQYCGGLIGANSGSVEMCYTYTSISASLDTGGLIGVNNGNVSKSFSKGTVSGNSNPNIGGFIGTNESGNISDCFSAANILSSYSSSGGFIGSSNGGDITRCYSSGMVQSGRYNTTGFIGSISNTTLSNCFWDFDSSMQSIGIGNAICSDSELKGLSTSEMENPANFRNAGFDDSIWDFSRGGAPAIKWSFAPVPPEPTPGISGNLQLQIGTKNNEFSKISIDTSLDLGTLNFNVLTEEEARKSIKALDKLIDDLSSKRSGFGANINILTSITDLNDIKQENLSAAKSVILDSDIAKENAAMIKGLILQQAASSLFIQSKEINSSIIMRLIKKN